MADIQIPYAPESRSHVDQSGRVTFGPGHPLLQQGVTFTNDHQILQSHGVTYVNASGFFQQFPDDVMTQTVCSPTVLEFKPTNAQFMEIMGSAGPPLIGGATVALLLLFALFIDTLVRLHRRYLPPGHKFAVAVILSVYPVLGLCSFLGILFPRSDALLDAASQLWWALCMLQFLRLTVLYFGGETAMVSAMSGAVLPWRSPPCCCWPCCVLVCPSGPVSKRQVRLVRMLVLQHPFVQCLLTVVGLSLWIEGWYKVGDFQPKGAFVYIFSASTLSFLLALWGFIVLFKASIPQLRTVHYGKKVIAFQLCLVFLRFQAMVFGIILVPSGAIPCVPPISPAVFANTVLCSLLLGQLVILSVLARHFFLLPVVPELSDQRLHGDPFLTKQNNSSIDKLDHQNWENA